MTGLREENISGGGKPHPTPYPAAVKEILSRVREQIGPCIQCGTCSASCPNLEFMDLTPRQMWRMVLGGRIRDLLNSRSFIYCSACYTCTLRCPRGLPLTTAMAELKQVGALMKLSSQRHRICSTNCFWTMSASTAVSGRWN